MLKHNINPLHKRRHEDNELTASYLLHKGEETKNITVNGRGVAMHNNVNLFEAGMHYIQLGLNVIATDNKKKAIHTWKQYQREVISEVDLKKQMENYKTKGIAITCGYASNGLEVIDVDVKNDVSGYLWEQLQDGLNECGLLDKFRIHKTRNGGYHLFYRCAKIEANQKLAMRPPTVEEQKENPDLKEVELIETRGFNGYVIAPPTPGYEIWQERPIPLLSPEDRENVLSVCRSLNEVHEEVNIDVRTYQQGQSSFDAYTYHDAMDLLISHRWTKVKEDEKKIYLKRPGNTDSYTSGNYDHSLNRFSFFSTNAGFETQKAYKPYAIYAVLECKGDFKKAAQQLAAAGYGNPTATNDLWQVSNKGAVTIRVNQILKFIGDNGFYRYKPDAKYKGIILVRLVEGVVWETGKDELIQFLNDHINEKAGEYADAVKEQVTRLGHLIYSDTSLLQLPLFIHSFLQSEKEIQYFPFSNGVVKVTKDDSQLLSYSDFNCVVWQDQIIEHHIELIGDDEEGEIEFLNFLNCISGECDEKLHYACQIIGYLLHTYKDASRPYAIILAEETDNEDKGGGTGKGIFAQALSKILRMVSINGKNFKIDKNFSLQRVNLDTQLIFVDDCAKNMDFEKFNSLVTEGVTIEKKNKPEIHIPYDRAPKFVFSTNYTLNIKGNHGKRRTRVFEFAPFFSPDKTPQAHFGHLLFDEWELQEWNKFYNLMFVCCQAYLAKGLSPLAESETMKYKRIRVEFGEEFEEYWRDLAKNEWRTFKTEFESFTNEYELSSQEFSRKRFNTALKKASDVFNCRFEKKKPGSGNNELRFIITT